MPRQLPDHAKSEDWSFRRLMQNVQAHHSREQIAPVLGDELSLSSFDYEGRTAKGLIPSSDGKVFHSLTFT
jgi:hypothetical protein